MSTMRPNISLPTPSSPLKASFHWPTVPRLVPHNFRRKLSSRILRTHPPASSFVSLERSQDPRKTAVKLLERRWTYYDLQYAFLLFVAGGSLYLNTNFPPYAKIAFSSLITVLLVIPITQQFFLPFLPIGTWLVLFFSCGGIPISWRPGIFVRLLPALERTFYGGNFSSFLSSHQAVIFDILAWFPYGIIHFGAPFVCSLVIFVYSPPGTVPVFARAFGYMNIIGVLIQLSFPCAPPWYENMYGLQPADYSIPGSPAGLARIDAITGWKTYTGSFGNSPLVFGAFPSLHAGSATIEALFMSEVFPQFSVPFGLYVGWLWWATMYLSHHYMVDLVGGSILAATVFHITRSNFLPRRQPGRRFRWDYDFAQVGYRDKLPDEEGGKGDFGE